VYQGRVARYHLSQIIEWISCKFIPFLWQQLYQARRTSLQYGISNYLKYEKTSKKELFFVLKSC